MVFQKGQHPHNFGKKGYKIKPASEERKQKMQEIMKNRVVTWGDKISKSKTGKDNGHKENCNCPLCTGPTFETIEKQKNTFQKTKDSGWVNPRKGIKLEDQYGPERAKKSIEKGRQKKLGKKRPELAKQKQSITIKSMYDNDSTFRENQKKGIRNKYDNDQNYRKRHAESIPKGPDNPRWKGGTNPYIFYSDEFEEGKETAFQLSNNKDELVKIEDLVWHHPYKVREFFIECFQFMYGEDLGIILRDLGLKGEFNFVLMLEQSVRKGHKDYKHFKGIPVRSLFPSFLWKVIHNPELLVAVEEENHNDLEKKPPSFFIDFNTSKKYPTSSVPQYLD